MASEDNQKYRYNLCYNSTLFHVTSLAAATSLSQKQPLKNVLQNNYFAPMLKFCGQNL